MRGRAQRGRPRRNGRSGTGGNASTPRRSSPLRVGRGGLTGSAGLFGPAARFCRVLVADPPRPADVTTSFPYVPALDGLRGLLVFPVLLFHFSIIGGFSGNGIAPGSYFAPSMFFTLSGFLITSLLLIERNKTGGVDWTGFWRRRFRRLVPASVAVIFAAAVFPLVWSNAWGRLPASNALAALLSFKNWQDIHYASSGTQELRTLGPLSPYWSLSIEEQFYLGMSIVIGLCMLTAQWRRWLTVAFAVLGTASVAALVMVQGSTPNRELFGTDIRASELVAGCLLAVAVQRYGWPSKWWWGLVGFASLAVTFVLWGWVTEHDAWVLNGGLAAVSLLNVGMILGAGARGSAFATAMSFRPLVEIGKLSYPLYLVHWPIALATQPVHTGMSGWPLLARRFVLSMVVAWPLAQYVEAPIRRQRVLKGWRFGAAWGATGALILVICALAGD